MSITPKDKTFIDIPTQEIDNIEFLASSAAVIDSEHPRYTDGNAYSKNARQATTHS